MTRITEEVVYTSRDRMEAETALRLAVKKSQSEGFIRKHPGNVGNGMMGYVFDVVLLRFEGMSE